MRVLALVFIGFLAMPFPLYLIADRVDILKKYYCKIGWHCHQKDYIYKDFDGVSVHCKCKWCGYGGMVDSQGNLF